MNPTIGLNRWILSSALGGWLLLCASGAMEMHRYADAAGIAGSAPKSWPGDSHLVRDNSRFTLVMFVHPRCPCSRASLSELGRLAAQLGGRAAIRIVFVQPSSTNEDWAKSDLWKSAEMIPEVVKVIDQDAVEATRFGAATSGQVLLYDAVGRLRFSGGITSSRGHEGGNAGEDQILSIVAGDHSALSTTPVFGCSLCARRATALMPVTPRVCTTQPGRQE